MKVLFASRINAEHEKAVEFNTDLAKMVLRRAEVVTFLKSENKREREKLRMEYAYSVVSAEKEPFLAESVKMRQPVRLVRTWVNKEQFMNLAKLFGIGGPDIAERSVSVIYYRVGGMMVKESGSGMDFLKSNVEISEGEWELLRSGRPPMTLFKNAA